MHKEKAMIIRMPFLKAMIALLILFLSILDGIWLARASDEEQIVFTRDGDMFIVSVDGGNERRVDEREVAELLGSSKAGISPDGEKIVFADQRCICISDIDGSNVKQLTIGQSDQYPSWSPDGEQIAFARVYMEKPDSGIYVMDADGANIRQLTGPLDTQGFYFTRPIWSPDGQKIFFHTEFWGLQTKPEHIWVMNADGSDQKLFLERARVISWSPDGRKGLIMRQDVYGFIWDICVMNADGSDIRCFGIYDTICQPMWSLDGASIAFIVHNDYPFPNNDIFVINADGSKIRQLTDTPEEEWLIGWVGLSYPAVKCSGKLMFTWGNIKEEMQR